MGNIGSFSLPPPPPDERVGRVLEDSSAISTGPAVSVLSEVVPIAISWRVRYAEVICAGYGKWELKVAGVRVGGGATGGGVVHDRTDLPGYIEAIAGDVVEVLYTYDHGPAAMPIDVFVGITEV